MAGPPWIWLRGYTVSDAGTANSPSGGTRPSRHVLDRLERNIVVERSVEAGVKQSPG